MATLLWTGAAAPLGVLTTTTVGTGDTPFDIVSTNTISVVDGGDRVELLLPDAASPAPQVRWTGRSMTDYCVRRYIKLDALPAATIGVLQALAVGSQVWRVELLSTGFFRLRDAANLTLFTQSANAISAGQYVRLEVVVSGGTATLFVYLDHTTSLLTTGSGATGAAAFDEIRFGRPAAVAATGERSAYMALGDTATLLGPAVTVATVFAGNDQLGVEPFTLVTLASTVVAGSVSNWAWTQLSGPSVSLSGSGASRTFIAPATTNTTTLVFQATGDGTATDQVTVQVYPQLDWLKTTGGLLPLRPGVS